MTILDGFKFGIGFMLSFAFINGLFNILLYLVFLFINNTPLEVI